MKKIFLVVLAVSSFILYSQSKEVSTNKNDSKTGVDIFWSSGLDSSREKHSKEAYKDLIKREDNNEDMNKGLNKEEKELTALLQEEDEIENSRAVQEVKRTINFNIEALKKGKLSLEEEHRNLYTINTILSLSVVILLCIWRYKLNKKRK